MRRVDIFMPTGTILHTNPIHMVPFIIDKSKSNIDSTLTVSQRESLEVFLNDLSSSVKFFLLFFTI